MIFIKKIWIFLQSLVYSLFAILFISLVIHLIFAIGFDSKPPEWIGYIYLVIYILGVIGTYHNLVEEKIGKHKSAKALSDIDLDSWIEYKHSNDIGEVISQYDTITFDYMNQRGVISKKTIDVNSITETHIYGYCHKFEDDRTYLISGIVNANSDIQVEEGPLVKII
ncbi:hypothetical protein [Francisella philomiragia]|uniref:Uncharacterized protein n=1 Tax=Francisella philomiragia TaxID=28110 RepID=A0ABS1GAV4_9GAMM|nr:hypothetical protein [Francisella philomiragia]MBK2258414.1 hypothetical protein [Francisella philomiragia]MBK2301788.1 hypothetical protein [Francisella philomiragia]